MEEGTSPPGPGGAVPKPQNPWEVQPSVTPFQEPLQSVAPPQTSYAPSGPSPLVYRAQDMEQRGGANIPRKSSPKKILKLIIGMFICIAILISVLVFFISSKSDNNPTEEVTLTYWGLFEDENVVRPVIAEFEKENPSIKIKYEKQDLSDYREKLSVRSANGNGPDVFRFHPSWYTMVSSILLPLPKETIEKNEFNQNYYEVAKRDLIRNGTIYGIPLYTDTLSLFVNTGVLQQVSEEQKSEIPIPKTWQEFIDTSTRLTKRNETGGIEIGGAGIGTYDNVTHAPDILSLLFAQNGVDLNNPSAYKEKIADALRFYTNFSQVEYNVWDSTQDFTQLAFAQGKLAMYFGYYWDMVTFKSSNPSLQFKVVPVPQLVSDERVNIASYWAEGANAKTQHPKETLLFMEFLARKETQEKLYAEQAKVRQFGEPYSIKSLADKLKDTDAFIFVDQSNTAVSSPFVGGAPDNGLNDKQNNNLKEAVSSILAQESEEEGAQKLLDVYGQAVGEFSGIISN